MNSFDLFSGQLVKERIRKPKARIMAGGSRKKEEGNKYDYFPTPEEAVKEIIDRELKYTSNASILEPACGEGHIVKVLEESGFSNVCYSDIRETEFLEGRGARAENFLLRAKERKVSTIVTNPPFSLMNEFVIKAKEIAVFKIVLLLKLTALAGQERYRDIWQDEEFPLRKVYVFSYRLDFEEEDPPPFEMAWYVWERRSAGETGAVKEPVIKWIY